MKYRIFGIVALVLFRIFQVQAAWFSAIPYEVHQPDGFALQCYVSGDEFYQWLHDEAGYTIVQAPDGYYYFAVEDQGQVLPGIFRAGLYDPSLLGLKPRVLISGKEYGKRKEAFSVHQPKLNFLPATGNVKNLSVFIRFADDQEFQNNRQSFINLFNTAGSQTVYSYFNEVSYGMLSMQTSFFPECLPSTNYSFQDTHTRSYYQPYNATTNPGGYLDFDERKLREHTLLMNAVNWVNQNSPVPQSLDIDSDDDGIVDHISFLVRGMNGGWSALLWAHSWSLTSYDVFINGKQVMYYTFTPESQSQVSTLCHETFHSMGAPDLYHYENTSLQPVQNWDLMAQGFGHMGAFMKYQYSNHNWISEVPEITNSGTYQLFPLASSGQNCYKIRSPYTNSEYFLLEYRKKEGLFENNLPGTGLLVYRINPIYYGNSNGPPDEVYIFRPGGTVTDNGNPSFANFCLEEGRTVINDTTFPSAFLQDGLPSGIMIHGISSTGTSITFQVEISSTEPAKELIAEHSGPYAMDISWKPNASGQQVVLAQNTGAISGNPLMNRYYQVGDSLPGGGVVIYVGVDTSFQSAGLDPNTRYYYKAWSFNYNFRYSTGISTSGCTDCLPALIPYYEAFDGDSLPNCWEIQQSDPSAEFWRISHTFYAGGSPYELLAISTLGALSYSRIILPPMNTVGITRMGVSFRMKMNDFFQGGTIRLQTSNDKVNWTHSNWFVATSGSGNHEPIVVNTSITQNLYSPATYLAILVEGQFFAFSSLFFDDIETTIEECDFFQVHLTSDPPEGGTVSGGGYFFPGQLVTVLAQPKSGWNFIGWKKNGILVCEYPDYSFQAEQDVSLVASYSSTKVNIVASCEPAGAGSVTGSGQLPAGGIADLSAEAAADYVFSHWTENGQVVCTTPGYSFSAAQSRYLTAIFIHRSCLLSLSASPSAGGDVTGFGTFDLHSTVSVHASAREGYQFAGWFSGGTMVSAMAGYTFELQEDTDLEARFSCPACEVNILVLPSEGGTVTGEGAYPSGTALTVNALPNTGYRFSEWSENGNKISSVPAYSFTVETYRNFTARFLRILAVIVEIAPAGSGFVVGEGNYTEGEAVTLGAFPNEDYEFLAWMEGADTLSHEAMLFFTIGSDRLLKACFRKSAGMPEAGGVKMRVFPNPASGSFTVLPAGDQPGGPVSVSMVSTSGQVWSPLFTRADTHTLRIDASSLPAGLYTLELTSSEGFIRRARVVIIR